MASGTDNQRICQQCGKPAKGMGAGSITQWVFDSQSCNCEFAGPDSQKEQDGHDLTICRECGKPVATEDQRTGSLTHWIFRANSCHCEHPGTPLAGLLDRLRIERQAESQPQPPVGDKKLTEELGLPEDRYLAIRCIARGGLAAVYRCWDQLLNKEVALKMPITSTWTKEQVLLFQREAKLLSKLSHPNVVQVIDMGRSARDQPFIVMELLQGNTLESILNERRLSVPETVRILLDVLEALRHVHNHGVLHRDLKPGNVLIVDDGDAPLAKIIDFGIAATTGKDQSQTAQSLSVAGSPHYMSPDQMQGLPYDERSDIYSFGCLMFQCFSGTTPFEGNGSLEVLFQHANSPTPTLAQADADFEFSPLMEHIVSKCLKKSPDERYQTVADVITAFQRLQEQIEIEESEAQDDTTGGADDETEQPALAFTFNRRVLLSTVSLSLLAILLALWMNSGDAAKQKVLNNYEKKEARREKHQYKQDGKETLWVDESHAFFSTVRKKQQMYGRFKRSPRTWPTSLPPESLDDTQAGRH